MELTVKDLYDFVRFVMNKTINGVLPPDKFNLLANIASKAYFDYLINGLNMYAPGSQIPKDAVDSYHSINKILQPFMNKSTLTLTTGLTVYPTTHKKTIKIYIDDAFEREIVWKRDFEISQLLSSFIDVIDIDYPVYKDIENNGIKVYPNTITSAKISFYRYPIDCKWNFTQVGSKSVYSSTGSIDLEWDEEALIPIVSRILASVGVNLKDNELIQYSQLIKQQ